MLYVVVMPVPIYVLALACIAILLLRALRNTKPDLLVAAMVWITLAGIALAFVALYFTSDYSISRRACFTGIYGVQGAQLLIAAQVIGLIVAFALKRHGTMDWLRTHKGLVALIVAGQVIAALALARSEALCTV